MSCNTLSTTHPTPLPEQNTAQHENSQSDSEQWDSHKFLQKHGVAWESRSAREINRTVFDHIKSEAVAETELLAQERGEYPDGDGSGGRNSHLLAIAPNASSGIILSTSPSIEPMKANAYTHRTRAGSFLVKNKYLEQLLEEKGENNESTWTSIITKKGFCSTSAFPYRGTEGSIQDHQTNSTRCGLFNMPQNVRSLSVKVNL